MRRVAVIVALVLIAAAGAVWTIWRASAPRTDPRALALLRASLAAERAAVLSGEMTVTETGNGGPTAASVDRDGKLSRIEYLSGDLKGQVLLTLPSAVYRLDPLRRTAVPTEVAAPDDDLSPLTANYAIVMQGPGRVAGRAATEIAVRSRHDRRVARRLWLDKATHFPLRRIEYDSDGHLASEVRFRQVRFGVRQPADRFRIPPDYEMVASPPTAPTEAALSPEELSQRVGFAVALPGYLPAGFGRPVGFTESSGRADHVFAGLRYSDGLRTLTILQRPSPAGDNQGPGERRRGRGPAWRGGRGSPPSESDDHAGRGPGGGRHGFGPPWDRQPQMVDWGAEKALRAFSDERMVIVIGDLSPRDLLKVARSVK